MSKKLRRLIALALCAVLLSGCGIHGGEANGRRGHTPLFSQMEYIRPDMDLLEKTISAAADTAKNEGGYIKLRYRLKECYEELYNFSTMTALAGIRADMNMTDEFYAEENAWCSEEYHTVRQQMDALYRACAESKYAGRLEKNFFWDGFADEYGGGENAYDDECTELMTEESALIAEYYALLTDPTIMLDGDEVKLSDYTAYVGSYDYMRTMTKFCEQYGARFTDIYVRLVKIRKQLAEKFGYDSYEQFQYEYFFDRDYTPQQAEAYAEDIKTYIVPIYKSIMAKDPYASVDYCAMDESETMALIEAAAREMGGVIEEAFDFMKEHELYDTEKRANKAARSYQTYITGYDAPFMFISPQGDLTDVLTAAHEFGHYTEAYAAFGAQGSVDLSEVFSQAMEYLLLGRLDKALGKESADNLRKIKLLDTLELYVQQAAFYEFEKTVYETDTDALTPEFLAELSLRLACDYGYYDGVNRSYYARNWVTVVHFFEQPFYVISYPVSNTVAMQIYELELRQEGSGLDKFFELLNTGTIYIVEAAEIAGLESPFSEGGVKRIANKLLHMLPY